MPNRKIELHDSELESLRVHDGWVVLGFSSAYIHESDGRPGIDPGTGWTQQVVVRIHGGLATGSLTALPCKLSDGYITLNGRRFDNQLAIPLNCDADVQLSITPQNAESVDIRGDHIALTLLGEPNYIERFPGANLA